MDSTTNLIEGSLSNSEEQTIVEDFHDAYYCFNEKLSLFVDTIHFLGKFSDILKIEFSEGLLKVEAMTPSKSAYGSAAFAESCFCQWDLGDLKSSKNRVVTLSAKHLTWAIRGVSRLHQFTIRFGGLLCTKTTITYVNNEEVTRTFELACRDLPIKYDLIEYERSQFCNHISVDTTAFDKYFQQVRDDDGLRFRIEGDSVFIEKMVEEADRGRVSNVFCTMPRNKFEGYQIEQPMLFNVSCKELKVAFKLISSYAHVADLYFEPGEKPMMITFDDAEQDVTCQVMVSISNAVTLDSQREDQAQRSDVSILDQFENSNLIPAAVTRSRTLSELAKSQPSPARRKSVLGTYMTPAMHKSMPVTTPSPSPAMMNRSVQQPSPGIRAAPVEASRRGAESRMSGGAGPEIKSFPEPSPVRPAEKSRAFTFDTPDLGDPAPVEGVDNPATPLQAAVNRLVAGSRSVLQESQNLIKSLPFIAHSPCRDEPQPVASNEYNHGNIDAAELEVVARRSSRLSRNALRFTPPEPGNRPEATTSDIGVTAAAAGITRLVSPKEPLAARINGNRHESTDVQITTSVTRTTTIVQNPVISQPQIQSPAPFCTPLQSSMAALSRRPFTPVFTKGNTSRRFTFDDDEAMDAAVQPPVAAAVVTVAETAPSHPPTAAKKRKSGRQDTTLDAPIRRSQRLIDRTLPNSDSQHVPSVIAASSVNVSDYSELQNQTDAVQVDQSAVDETPSKRARTSSTNPVRLILEQLSLGYLVDHPRKPIEVDLPTPGNIIV